MDQLLGLFLYFLSLLTVGGIFALLALGLNVQWGFAGLFNVGIAGFAAVGAYTYAILTTDTSPFHLGGLGLPLVVGVIAAMILSGVIAGIIGVICISPTSRLPCYCYHRHRGNNKAVPEKPDRIDQRASWNQQDPPHLGTFY